MKCVFGYFGDGINGIMGVMGWCVEVFDYICVCYEEMVVFMVGVYVKFIGEVGVCLVILGLGVIYLLNGFYDVCMDY